jgi:hypothetical protein
MLEPVRSDRYWRALGRVPRDLRKPRQRAVREGSGAGRREIVNIPRVPLQAFRRDCWEVASRSYLSDALRYLVQRLVEQQDEDTLVAGSGTSRLDPLSAVVEGQRVARSHHVDGQPTYELAHSVLTAVQRALTDHQAEFTAWFGAPFQNAKMALAAALSGTRARFKAAAQGLASIDLPALEHEFVAGPTPLRRCLLDQILSPPVPLAQEDLDSVIDMFGATLVAEGRNGAAFANALVACVRAATDHHSSATAIRALVDRPSEKHCVAMILVGSSQPRDVDAFDCALVTTPQRWPADCGAEARADSRLADFKRTHAAGNDRSLLVTSVDAFDMHGARDRAGAKAQALIDQYSSRHRIANFKLAGSYLVMRSSDQRTNRPHRIPHRLGKGKAYSRTSGPLPQTIDAFRYAALARDTEAPVVQVLHRWIALESLAHGARDLPLPDGRGRTMRAADFVTQRVADLVALQAIRQSLTASWDVVRIAARRSTSADSWRDIENWLDVVPVSGRLADLTRWTALLAAQPTRRPTSLTRSTSVRPVAKVVEGQLRSFNPFAEQAFLRWQTLLRDTSRFARWVNSIREDTRVALLRMYAVRNASVHSAVGEVRGAEQLTIAARNIVDAVLEVLPNWLEGHPSRRPWEALNLVALRYRAVIAANLSPGTVSIDADRLTLEAGDGVVPQTPVV